MNGKDAENDETVALRKMDGNLEETTTAEKTPPQDEDVLQDGCIILGDGAEKGARYYTRFHIDRAKQREILSVKQVLIKSCCPCFLPGRKPCVGRIWQILRSQVFLVSMHLLVVVFGVLKECLNLRTVAKDAHMMHTIAETFITILIVTIRLVSAWHAFKQLKVQRSKVEYLDPQLGVKPRSRAVKKLLISYTVTSVFLLLMAVVCFVLFYTLAHLGWTILTNNFALVTVMAFDGLLRGRMTAEGNLVREDHSKAVTYEMSLLLNEAMSAPDGPLRERVNSRVKRFQKAFRDTSMFNQPDYISIPDEKLNMLTTMQVI